MDANYVANPPPPPDPPPSPPSPSPLANPSKAGDVLLSIEAMKMEAALHAERDGTVAEVFVKTGDQIDTKDLLISFS